MAYASTTQIKGVIAKTRRICALTRMEALISDTTMIDIVEQLPNATKVGLTSFSSRRIWEQQKETWRRINWWLDQ